MNKREMVGNKVKRNVGVKLQWLLKVKVKCKDSMRERGKERVICL